MFRSESASVFRARVTTRCEPARAAIRTSPITIRTSAAIRSTPSPSTLMARGYTSRSTTGPTRVRDISGGTADGIRATVAGTAGTSTVVGTSTAITTGTDWHL